LIAMGSWRAGASGLLAIAMCLAVWSVSQPRGGAQPSEALQAVSAKLVAVKAQATAKKSGAARHLPLAPGTKLADGTGAAVAAAAAVKSATGEGSAEGQNLQDEDPDMPDMKAIAKVQAAMKEQADAEVDDAVSRSKAAATASYAESRDAFMVAEAANPNAGTDGAVEIYPKEGSPGHPVGYAVKPTHSAQRVAKGAAPKQAQQRLARSRPAAAAPESASRQARAAVHPPATPGARAAKRESLAVDTLRESLAAETAPELRRARAIVSQAAQVGAGDSQALQGAESFTKQVPIPSKK
jgi:hypothetical protein